MPTLYITEYASLARDGNNWIMPIPQEPALATQAVTFTTATSSNAFNAGTHIVRAVADADCFVLFGAAPEAVATSTRLIAEQEYWFGVRPGHKGSAYDGSS